MKKITLKSNNHRSKKKLNKMLFIFLNSLLINNNQNKTIFNNLKTKMKNKTYWNNLNKLFQSDDFKVLSFIDIIRRNPKIINKYKYYYVKDNFINLQWSINIFLFYNKISLFSYNKHIIFLNFKNLSYIYLKNKFIKKKNYIKINKFNNLLSHPSKKKFMITCFSKISNNILKLNNFLYSNNFINNNNKGIIKYTFLNKYYKLNLNKLRNLNYSIFYNLIENKYKLLFLKKLLKLKYKKQYENFKNDQKKKVLKSYKNRNYIYQRKSVRYFYKIPKRYNLKLKEYYKKKKKIGIIQIRITFNNIFILLKDFSFNELVLYKLNAGLLNIKGPKKQTPVTSEEVVNGIISIAKKNKIKSFILKVNGVFHTRRMKSALFNLFLEEDIEIIKIINISSKAHNGLRQKKKRRV